MEARQLLPIVRYWSPVGSQPRNAPPFGIVDALLYRAFFLPESHSLEELADASCLFLLGEPALGKSTAIWQEVERLRATLPGNELVIRIDLDEVSSGSELDEEFHTTLMHEWRDGASTLHLFLDSYDECLRQYPGLGSRLMRNLRILPLDRIRLRIACRSGDFPGSLLQEIVSLWPKQTDDSTAPIQLLRLEPLSGIDIRAWVEAASVPNVDAFLDEVQSCNATMFAQRPITLKALISSFKRGELPSNEVELFAFASRALCSETNGDQDLNSNIPLEGRFALAERIAVLMTLGGKDRLWLGPSTETPSDAMSIEDVSGGEEFVGSTRVVADSLAIREVVRRCAVFEVHEAHLVRWSQQSYREFLAASYFTRRLEEKTKALQFFEHPGRPGSTSRPIAPQLTESVAWLAAMDEPFAALVAEYDPIVLLGTQHFIFPSIRPRLATWLLEETAAGRAVNLGQSAERSRNNVCHDGLASRLAEYLNDTTAHVELRTLASWLVGACQFRDLAPALLTIAHNDLEHLSTRWAAVLALEEIGIDDDKGSLRPLLESITGDSAASHRLRAQVLRTLWPSHITTPEALDYLRAHQRSSTDEYRNVFRGNFASVTDPVHLTQALTWMTNGAQGDDEPLEWHFAEILLAASKAIDDQGVREALASTLVARALTHDRLVPYHSIEFYQTLRSQPTEMRAALVEAIGQEAANRSANFSTAAYHITGLIDRLELPYDELVSLVSRSGANDQSLWWKVLTADTRTWATHEGEHPIRKALAANDLDPPARELFALLDSHIEASRQASRGPTE